MSDKYFVDTNILVYAHDRSPGSNTSALSCYWNNFGVRDRAY
jgi:predicted nucleic acid-binding protein